MWSSDKIVMIIYIQLLILKGMLSLLFNLPCIEQVSNIETTSQNTSAKRKKHISKWLSLYISGFNQRFEIWVEWWLWRCHLGFNDTTFWIWCSLPPWSPERCWQEWISSHWNHLLKEQWRTQECQRSVQRRYLIFFLNSLRYSFSFSVSAHSCYNWPTIIL